MTGRGVICVPTFRLESCGLLGSTVSRLINATGWRAAGAEFGILDVNWYEVGRVVSSIDMGDIVKLLV